MSAKAPHMTTFRIPDHGSFTIRELSEAEQGEIWRDSGGDPELFAGFLVARGLVKPEPTEELAASMPDHVFKHLVDAIGTFAAGEVTP